MAASTAQVLSLYRKLMKESSKFPSYNYRTYALRRVQDAFRANRSVEDPKMVEQLLNQGRDNLDMIRRQVGLPQTHAHAHTHTHTHTGSCKNKVIPART
ncbi:LYR motif-containing protein 4B [Oncorhynchus keta]|uniref:LYR motif-containing protein 4B n=1 Tax=Oncorhynchus keta TaxID=8018 RepID=UPI00227B9835|nr:LYR motif-containing protein 4B [Oncorhynchus keta]